MKTYLQLKAILLLCRKCSISGIHITKTSTSKTKVKRIEKTKTAIKSNISFTVEIMKTFLKGYFRWQFSDAFSFKTTQDTSKYFMSKLIKQYAWHSVQCFY